jgi:membrane protein DedA with SNARE-associated domain
VFRYIKEHWVQYLIGATIAVLLGLGLSYYLGEKWSTPDSVRAQRAEENQAVTQEDEELTEWVSS